MPRWGALCRSALSKVMGLLVGVCRLGQREVLVRLLGVSSMVMTDRCRLSPSSASDGCDGLNGFDDPQIDRGR